jgi:3-phosphoshikimate 1-carboxyvinyltransferase
VSIMRVEPALHGLRGRLKVPGDKSISHRALLLAALADGRSLIEGCSRGGDVAATLAAIRSFGALAESDTADRLIIEGGRSRLHEPEAPVDLGNSGTALRLLAGWAATVEGLSVLCGDSSLSRRPMGRVVAPLRLMGARIDGRRGGELAPLVVRGGGLHGIDYRLPVSSAQVKAAILLAGLAAEGPTTVRESTPTRAHTEEMLAELGADVAIGTGEVTLRPGPVAPFELTVPGDPSQAAFWVVGACVCRGSDLRVEDVYLGPARTGFVNVLRRMGADITVEVDGKDAAGALRGSIRAVYSELKGTWVEPSEVPALIDEIPVLAVAAACASGTTTVSGAAELAVKESNRIDSIVGALCALGARCEARPDGLVVHGRGGERLPGGATVESAGDHRVAMAAAIGALAAESPVTIAGWEWVATSYPGFEEDLKRCVS